MRKWLSGGAIVAVTAVGTYLVFPNVFQKPPAPAPQPECPATTAAPAPDPAPAPPAMLAEVVDVTDISALLDPPPPPPSDSIERGPVITAVGMVLPADNAVQPASAVIPIPRANE